MSPRAWLLIPLLAACAHPRPPTAATVAHAPAAPAPTVRAPLFDNLGAYHRQISTAVPEAQRYFDQGLRLIFAFNHDEALRAFQEAARLDPSCAACVWGAALTLGPNYNLPALPDRAQLAYSFAQMALAKKGSASPVEAALIDALALRYAKDPPKLEETGKQAALDGAYAAAMRQVAARFADDLDVATLFAESMMDLRPWKLWKPDGSPEPGTDELVATLERVLQKNPQHPGANHYYIHALEASKHPERALPSAQRVGNMMPGAGHLVHMPSHVYMRVGKYEEASQANRDAIGADQAYAARTQPPGFYPMYMAHNFQFLWASAMMEGRAAESLGAARELLTRLPVEMLRQMPGFDFVLPAPSLALVRFGRWEEVLKETPPPEDLKVASALYHYARGRAYAALGRKADAVDELATIDRIAGVLPADAIASQAKAKDLLTVASRVLAAAIDPKNRIRLLEQAVEAADRLPYDEPPIWYYPPRHTLGAALIAAGRLREAEQVYRDDLARNPNNPWAWKGLALSCHGAPRGEAEAHFRDAARHADVSIA